MKVEWERLSAWYDLVVDGRVMSRWYYMVNSQAYPDFMCIGEDIAERHQAANEVEARAWILAMYLLNEGS